LDIISNSSSSIINCFSLFLHCMVSKALKKRGKKPLHYGKHFLSSLENSLMVKRVCQDDKAHAFLSN
jgi:hypothetical protein